MFKWKTKGYSLLEVLVVVAIVGSIASFAIPGYGKYIRKARRSIALSELNSMVLMLNKRYATANPNSFISIFPYYKSDNYYDYYYSYYSSGYGYTYWYVYAYARNGTSQTGDTETDPTTGVTYGCQSLYKYANGDTSPKVCFDED